MQITDVFECPNKTVTMKNVKCFILKLNVKFCIIMGVAGDVTFKSAM